ncbi:hypothetical protein [Streptomyces sp. NPDC101455]|uniref:hypothetical protein n=1 Tax=Streptomyces sp. NPDC101455 TaxID=3366142 RepID=UPI00381D1E6D
MTPLERLLAEELPTGTFGHAQPASRHSRTIRPWTPEEQAQHLADLTAALDGWEDTADRARRRRHLRIVEETLGSEVAA